MWVRPFTNVGKLSPPEAESLSSSCVRLEPGASVGEHETAGKEELLFVIEGEATLRVGGDAATIPAGHVAYVPPNTRHDVANRGRTALVYVYTTAKLSGGKS